MKDLRMSVEAARKLWATSCPETRAWLEENFSKKELAIPPKGVWCLSMDDEYIAARDWKGGEYKGVCIITEGRGLIIAPHVTVSLQWGAMGKDISKLSTNRQSYDCKTATNAILASCAVQHYRDGDGRIWDVDGAPAAEWCRQYDHAGIEWDLATVAQLELMHKHRDQVNECMEALGGYKLTPGGYWSSTIHSSGRALLVCMGGGYVDDVGTTCGGCVRAVSAFHFE